MYIYIHTYICICILELFELVLQKYIGIITIIKRFGIYTDLLTTFFVIK